jgi:glycosyltransferase involved in cell wall biosynthesis
MEFLQAPRISVVIPTRNRPELVQRAITSALMQSVKDIEVIVVIDGTDPATTAQLAQIKDQRLVVIALEDSVGGAEARNVGARHARGQWIALLDDDDEWLQEKLARQLAVAERSGNCRTLVTSKYLERRTKKPDMVRPRRLPRKNEQITDYMFDYLCYFQTSTFFCSRELFLDISFKAGLKNFQDIDWFLRVGSDPSVNLIIIPEPLSIYHAPELRAGITRNLGWEARLKWGQNNRELMSRRAYSRFIVGSCVGRAVEDGCGFGVFRQLFYEFAIVGSPTPRLLAVFFGICMVSTRLRRFIRDKFFLSASSQSIGISS